MCGFGTARGFPEQPRPSGLARLKRRRPLGAVSVVQTCQLFRSAGECRQLAAAVPRKRSVRQRSAGLEDAAL
jgi:hypothetical protein